MGLVAAIWGIGGVIAMLVYAIVRLAIITLDSFEYEYTLVHWLALVVNIAFMAYSEGYKGFQKAFSPRVVARAKYLIDKRNLAFTVLAPLFCMGYFHASRRRLITTYVMTALIVLFIIGAHMLPHPWRGILDAGVVVGLSWGVASIVAFTIKAFTDNDYGYSPEVP